MKSIIKLASIAARVLFKGKPLTQRLSDGATFIVKQELSGEHNRRAFFRNMAGLLDKIA